MKLPYIPDWLRFFFSRLRQRLWVRPLAMCLISIAAVFAAAAADRSGLPLALFAVNADSLVKLLSIMASSMLVIAIFSVSSMVAAYASASNTATPRSFPLVVADDVSQNALSTFVGAFIFSIVALVAVTNGHIAAAGRCVLFVMTMTVFAVVILTFVRWVDRVARLGRLSTTIETVERTAAEALELRRRSPTLLGAPVSSSGGRRVCASSVGYVQRVDVPSLQKAAESKDWRVVVEALPGTFVSPGRALARIIAGGEVLDDDGTEQVREAFTIGDNRLFDDDPRLGLIVLSEIAGRALSPAVNDPGTAIDIIGRLVRLLTAWSEPVTDERDRTDVNDRVEVPTLRADDLFDDAFTAIARDGAGSVEVVLRLQKGFASLASVEDPAVRQAAVTHARRSLARAELAMALPADLDAVRHVAARVTEKAAR